MGQEGEVGLRLVRQEGSLKERTRTQKKELSGVIIFIVKTIVIFEFIY